MIEEEILNGVAHYLNESQGINDIVEAEADKLCNYINKNLRKAEIKCDNKNQIKYKTLEYASNFDAHRFMWGIKAIILKNEACFEDDAKIKFSEGRNTTDGKRYFYAWVTFYMTEDGWFSYAELCDTIYHEIQHLFKAEKRKNEPSSKDFITFSNSKYNFCNGLEKDIAVICYMSIIEEQDAFINGFYAYMKYNLFERQNIDEYNVFESSAIYQKIKEIKNAIKNIKSADKSEINKYLNEYEKCGAKLTFKKILYLGEVTLKRLYKKVVLVMKRFQKYLYNNNYKTNPPGITILDFLRKYQ